MASSSYPNEDGIPADQQSPNAGFSYVSGVAEDPPKEPQHLVPEVPNGITTSLTSEGDGAVDITMPQQTQPPVAGDGESQHIPASMYLTPSSTTGLDVDSNPTETDHSDSDSAIGNSIYSSTFSTSSSVYDFVEENGRTYHRFKEGKYHLPNDEVSFFIQQLVDLTYR